MARSASECNTAGTFQVFKRIKSVHIVMMTGCEDMVWTQLDQVRVHGQDLADPSGSITGGEFLDQLSKYHVQSCVLGYNAVDNCFWK
jgi:hypothetical protein